MAQPGCLPGHAIIRRMQGPGQSDTGDASDSAYRVAAESLSQSLAAIVSSGPNRKPGR